MLFLKSSDGEQIEGLERWKELEDEQNLEQRF